VDDIVKRLRERRITRWIHSTGQTPQASGYAVDAECNEAADTIERLRAALRDLLDTDVGYGGQGSEVDAAVEAARAALGE
jgi:hypothetical protein